MAANKNNYDDFYFFRDVMRCGSYQKAAKELGSTTATIKKKITQMEESLNITLFEKDCDDLTPTAAGLFLYDELDSILWNLDTTLQRARSIPAPGSMKLSLGITDMVSGEFYGKLIRKFSECYSDTQLVLSTPFLPELRSRLNDGRMDAALTYSIGLPNEPSLNRMPLMRGKPCIYYHSELLQESIDQISIDSFQKCAFVCLNTDVAATNMLKHLPFDPQKVIFAESLRSLYLYVNSGLACTILGPFQQFHETKNISMYELKDSQVEIGIDLVWEKSNLNPALNLLLDSAQKVYLRKEDPDLPNEVCHGEES